MVFGKRVWRGTISIISRYVVDISRQKTKERKSFHHKLEIFQVRVIGGGR